MVIMPSILSWQPEAQPVMQQEHSASNNVTAKQHERAWWTGFISRPFFESKWLRNEDGEGILKSELKTRIGTDENKVFIKIHADQG